MEYGSDDEAVYTAANGRDDKVFAEAGLDTSDGVLLLQQPTYLHHQHCVWTMQMKFWMDSSALVNNDPWSITAWRIYLVNFVGGTLCL